MWRGARRVGSFMDTWQLVWKWFGTGGVMKESALLKSLGDMTNMLDDKERRPVQHRFAFQNLSKPPQNTDRTKQFISIVCPGKPQEPL